MITRMLILLRRFRREQDGTMSVELVLYFTVLMAIFSAAVEIAMINLRHVMLERAVELTVRDLRLSTGEIPSYDELRNGICGEMGIGQTCQTNLLLEMAPVDPRNFVPLPAAPDCINAQQEPRPVRQFDPGDDNQLMLMRTCLKYNPIFPSARFAKGIDIDADGYGKLIVRSVFVQEPR